MRTWVLVFFGFIWECFPSGPVPGLLLLQVTMTGVTKQVLALYSRFCLFDPHSDPTLQTGNGVPVEVTNLPVSTCSGEGPGLAGGHLEGPQYT